MERIVCNKLTLCLKDRFDPLQFAYKAKRGVEDATLGLLNFAVTSLDKPGSTVRVLMMDFSSAFNTMQTYVLLKRLLDLDVSPGLVLWIKSFLTDRPQRVKVDDFLSNEVILNTGAPQGCVLSPILFSIYTNEIMCNTDTLKLIKFADDMALAAKITNELLILQYFDYIQKLLEWFRKSHLFLNVTKTKEIIFEEKRAKDPSLLRPVTINNVIVEKVNNFKYLGTVFDKDLNFSLHVDMLNKKANQRLFLLRKLKGFSVSTTTLDLVYKSLIQSILTFNIVTWFGNLREKERSRLNRLTNIASKVVGKKQDSLAHIYVDFMERKAKKIVSDYAHPLNSSFRPLRSGQRFLVPLAKRILHKHSFIPSAIQILNSGQRKK